MDKINYLIKQIWCYVKNNTIKTIVAGDNITIDNSDPKNPIISSTGGGSGGTSVWSSDVLLGYQFGKYSAGSTLPSNGKTDEETDPAKPESL